MDQSLMESFKSELPKFFEAAKEYFAGNIPKKDYKGISGGFGSYAQREDDKCMLRLRMTAGSVPKDNLKFVVDATKKYSISKVHFTTCQAIQLHDLGYKEVTEIAKAGYEHGIVTRGTGCDNPRNTMCSPLSGVEIGEYFDVMPYAKAAGDYALTLINQGKIPRKYKIVFSNSPKNATHATFHDLGFVARSDGKFDVYASGGLGPNPKMGVLIGESVEPDEICHYIYAQWKTFSEHGNYQNRSKARTRYLIESCGGEEKYKEIVHQNLEAIKSSDDLTLNIVRTEIKKVGDGNIDDERVIPQKQNGLYTVEWHTVGGCPKPGDLEKLYETIKDFKDVEMRLGSYETAYIINLTVNGEHYEGKERFGDIVGDIFEEDIPKFLVKLGQTVDKSGLGFEDWNRENPHGIIDIAKDFIVE